MKRISILAMALLITGSALFVSCSSNSSAQASEDATVSNDASTEQANTPAASSNMLTANDVFVTASVNNDWVKAGKSIYELKCQACHKLTDEKLVGPGWKDVTKTRKPEWIMNMILNTDEMINNDPEAQKLLETHLVRMPNQNLSKDEARQVLEFMRSNDGVK